MIESVIFDMDGVLVDSEEYICEAAVRMYREKGIQVKHEDFTPFVGMGENRYLGGVAEQYGVPLDLNIDKPRTYEIYLELIKGKLDPLPGVLEFIARAREKGLKLAVATSADHIKMVGNLEEIGIPEETFDACVHGNMVENKKPHPEIFLTAADRIGADPTRSLVVEDAVSGVKAAKAAGSKCLALTTSFTPEELAGADWFASTLADAPKECLEW